MANSTRERSRHLVDSELLPIIAAFPPIGLSDETLAALRTRPIPQPALSEAAAGVALSYRHVAGLTDAPDVRVACYRPPLPGILPAVLHIHGGGFVSGTLEGTAFRQRELAAAIGCLVVSVDYRLAPETRFPGAVEDCYAVLGWLVCTAAALEIDVGRIAVKGESAGGGLAAALALLARDRGEFAIAHQHLTYPMLDDRTGVTRPCADHVGEYIWTLSDSLFGWRALLGCAPGAADVSRYAAPARAHDLSGLPSAYVMTGALDLFADESIDYARRLAAAGVPTELHVYPGAFHGFDLAPTAAVAVAARAASNTALARALAAPPAAA